MDKELLSLIGIRLIAIYLMVTGIVNLPIFAQLWMNPAPKFTLMFGYSAAILSPLLIGIILYTFSLKLSNIISKGLNTVELDNTNIILSELHGVVLSVTGLMIIAMKFPDFVSVILQISQTAEINNRQAEYFSNIHFLSEFMVLALGISLFLGARFWVNFYKWFQRFGLENK